MKINVRTYLPHNLGAPQGEHVRYPLRSGQPEDPLARRRLHSQTGLIQRYRHRADGRDAFRKRGTVKYRWDDL